MELPCGENYSFGYRRRAIICQTETLKSNVACADAEFQWNGLGQTTEDIPLRHSFTHSLTVNCIECGDTDTATYCFPFLYPICPNSTLHDCDNVSPETVAYVDAFETTICGGDTIDWTTVEFDLLPTGITCVYGGAPNDIDVTVDHTVVVPGVYHIPTRVTSVGGIKSNWALLRVVIYCNTCLE